jgi:hypothetical protein
MLKTPLKMQQNCFSKIGKICLSHHGVFTAAVLMADID